MKQVRFCPSCGKKLTPVEKKSALFLMCLYCKYKEEVKEVRAVPISKASEQAPIIIVDKELQEIRTFPLSKEVCPKCGHIGAFWWTVQLRGSDESSTQFFRCQKCGYTWREIS